MAVSRTDLKPRAKFDAVAAVPVCAPDLVTTILAETLPLQRKRTKRGTQPQSTSSPPKRARRTSESPPVHSPQVVQDKEAHVRSAQEQLRLLVEVVAQSCTRYATGDDWLDFWLEHISEYSDRVRSIHQLLGLVGVIDNRNRRTSHQWESLRAAFPDEEDEISFFEFAYARAMSRSSKLHSNQVTDPDKQAADREAAGFFNQFAPFFGMCVTTLNIIAAPRTYRLDTDDLEITDEVFEVVWWLARHSLDNMSAAVVAAEKLRGFTEERALTDPIILDDESFKAFTTEIENPAAPNNKLRALFNK
jgi:hypothetical protein